jgi:ssDNA-binding Zn-finger/Zn-ribbon topoisomerase 1
MHFAYSNLAVNVVCLVLRKHASDKLQCTQDLDSPISQTPYIFYQCAQFPDCEGAYLYYDANKGCFVHSGKLTRRGFSVRGKDHFDESKNIKSSTAFYDLYLSSTCPRAHKRWTKGTFDTLKQIIAAGWDLKLLSCEEAGQMLEEWWSLWM